MLDPDISTADARRLLSSPDLGADPTGPAGWSRRKFLQAVGLGIGGGALLGVLGDGAIPADVRQAFAGSPIGPTDGIVVLITHFGGNDGLNTVVPYSNSLYYGQRGSVAIPASSVLPLDGTHGLHPSLTYLKTLWDRGQVAIVHGSGYPNPDLSHFSSMATWMHASFQGGAATSGWVGRWLDGLSPSVAEMAAATIDSSVPLHMQGFQRRGLGIPPSGDLFGATQEPADVRMYAGLKALSATSAGRGPWHDMYATVLRSHLAMAADVAPVFAPAPAGGELTKKLTIAARLINADLGFRVLDVGHGSFDTHDGQTNRHAALLKDLDDGLAAFFATLSPAFASRVTLVTLSEFGRTPYANASGGTDHGTANVQLVVGPNVRGGHYGQPPSLAVRNQWDRLVSTVDFRAVLGTVIDGWMGGGGGTVLEGSFENLGFFRAGPGQAPAGGGGLPPIVTSPTSFVPLPPARVFDTRTGEGVRSGAVGPAGVIDVAIAGRGGVPADAVAVALNVTATGATAATWLTVWPSGAVRPNASNLNPVAGGTAPNLVVCRLGTGGKVSIYNDAGNVHVLGDVAGYFANGGTTGLTPLTPARLLDTRNAIGGVAGPVGAGQAIDVKVAGVGPVPADAIAVALNVTATEPTRTSFVTIYPKGVARPNASSLNTVAGVTVPNMVLAKVGADGSVSLYNDDGAVHLIADVLGAFRPSSGAKLVVVDPARLLDTRSGVGAPRARVGQSPLRLQVAGTGPVPSSASAVLLNVTAVAPTAGTYVTVSPSGTARPTTSNLNVEAGRVVPNMVLATLGSGGAVDLFNAAGTVDLLADVLGFFTAAA